MIASVHGPLAFISMPGLVAVAVGFILGAIGALVFTVGLVCFAVSAWRIELRAAGTAAAVAGLILGLAGAGIAVFGDEARDGDLADAISPVLALIGVFAAGVAAMYVARRTSRPTRTPR
jgi:hypothetical protein